MSDSIFDHAQKHFPTPIATAVDGLNRAVSLHERRDRIIDVFRTTMRVLSAYAIAVRVQFGEGSDGESKTLVALMEGLRRRGLTDGQWVSIVRELLREYKSAPETYPIVGMVELFHKKRAKFARLTNELLDMRKSQTVAHGRILSDEDLREVIEERLPQLESLLEELRPIFERTQLAIGNGSEAGKGVDILHGLGSTAGAFPSQALLGDADDTVEKDALCLIVNRELRVMLHPTMFFRSPLAELLREIFVFERRGKKGAKLLSIPNMYEIETEEAWVPIEEAFFVGESFELSPELEGLERPFRGLESFQPKHAPLFFGRESEIEELTNRIRRNGFVVLTGPSGTGKSSLIQAGVLPEFSGAELHIVRPSSSPLYALAQTLDALIPTLSSNQIVDLIKEGEIELVIEALLESTASRDRLTVLVVDQGEELITLCSDAAIRERFGEILAEIGGYPESNIRVVYSLREDFFGPVGVVEKIKSVFSRQVMVMSTPSQEDLMMTLVGPARLFGYQFEDFELLQEMTQAVVNESSALALLQFCADKMWDRRDRHRRYLTRDSYQQIGGVGGALANHAEETMKQLTLVQQAQAKGMFLRLVTDNRTKQLCSRHELIEGTQNAVAAEQLLDALLSARLLTSRTDTEGGEPFYELIHEALISHWTRLRDWLLQNQEGQRTLLALRQAAIDWEERSNNVSLLWTGDMLEELRHFKRVSDLQLTSLESQFVLACESLALRTTRIRNGLIALAFLVVSAFSVFSYYEYRQAEKQRILADEQRELAEEQSQKAFLQTLDSKAKQSELEIALDEELAFYRAGFHFGLEHTQDVSQFRLQQSELNAEGSQTFVGHTNAIITLAQSQDGKFILTGSRDTTVKVWDSQTGKLLHTLENDLGTIFSISIDSADRFVALGSMSPVVKVWDLQSGGLIHTLEGHQKDASQVQVSSNGKYVVTGSIDGTAKIWDLKTGKELHTLNGHALGVKELILSNDNRFVVTGDGQGVVKIWGLDNGELRHILEGHKGGIISMFIDSYDDVLVTGANDGDARVWDIETGQLRHTFEGQTDSLLSVNISVSGGYALTTSTDGSATIWDLLTGQPLRTFKAHDAGIPTSSVSTNGDVFVTGSFDGTAKVWDVATGKILRTLYGHRDGVLSVLIGRDNQTVFTVSLDDALKRWRLDKGDLVDVYASHTDNVVSVDISSNDRFLVTGSKDKTAKIWDLESGQLRHTLEGHDDRLRPVQISPDNKYVVTGSYDNTAKVWDVQTGGLIHTLADHTSGIPSLKISSDGKYVVTGSLDKTANIWNLNTGELIRSLEEHQGGILKVDIDAFNQRVVTMSGDGTIKAWDIQTGQSLYTLSANPSIFMTFELSSDNRYLVTGSMDKTAKVWNLSNGTLLHTLAGNKDMVVSLAIDPSNEFLLMGTGTLLGNSFKSWDLSSGRLNKTVIAPKAMNWNISISPNGHFGLTSTKDHTTVLWDLSSYKVLHVYDWHLKSINSWQVTSDNRYLVTVSNDNTAKMWRMPISDPQELLRVTGERTNARVCRDTLEVVNVLPFPDPMTVWAPEELCTPKSTE